MSHPAGSCNALLSCRRGLSCLLNRNSLTYTGQADRPRVGGRTIITFIMLTDIQFQERPMHFCTEIVREMLGDRFA